jgi:hypothetical protein
MPLREVAERYRGAYRESAFDMTPGTQSFDEAAV